MQYHQLEAGNADLWRTRNLQYHQLEATGADVIRLRNLQYFELADFSADVTRTRNLQAFQLCAQLRVAPPVQKAAHCVPFSINVDVNEGSDLYSFEFRLQYDPAVLQATGVTLGSFLNPPTTIIKEELNQTFGFVVFSASSVSPALPASGSGTIATIAFDSIPGGNSAFQLLDIQLLDLSSQILGHQAIDGFFECIPVWGDANADHLVNCVDLFNLGKAFGSIPGDSDWNRYCDLDGDESVGELDLQIFSQNFGKTWSP